MSIPSISVMHLVWMPSGIECFKSFIISYKKYGAGVSHNLIIIFNGVKYKTETTHYHEFIQEQGLIYESFYYEHGQDIDCYFWTAKQITTGYIIVLNSFSVILSDNWLKKYIDNFDEPEVGIIGATASFQSYYSSVFQKHQRRWEREKGFLYNFRKYKLFIKAFFYWRFLFKAFPNPHIRTNAFMVRRTEFLKMYNGPVNTKFKAYLFENGRNSLTNKYLEAGMKVLLIDKYGRTYQPHEWKESKTFWINDQENLLISDNQTMIYQFALAGERKSMSKLAWG